MPYIGAKPTDVFADRDLNGAEFILDADADTSITADTDDQIDIRISGADDFQFTANTFTASSGSSVVQTDGLMFLGDTANAKSTLGFTINQGAADNESFALKSTDVAHGKTTDHAETDTYFSIAKANGGGGGVLFQVLAENDRAEGVCLWKVLTDPTLTATKGTANWGAAYEINIFGHDGADSYSDHTANGNLFSIAGQVGGARRYVFGVDVDGDVYSDSGTAMTQFDDKDDAMLLRTFAIETSTPSQTIRTNFDNWLNYNRDDLIEANIIGDDREPIYDEAGNRSVGLVNTTQLARLHTGAIVQQRAMFETMKQVVGEMLPGFGTKLNARLAEQNLPALPVSV